MSAPREPERNTQKAENLPWLEWYRYAKRSAQKAQKDEGAPSRKIPIPFETWAFLRTNTN